MPRCCCAPAEPEAAPAAPPPVPDREAAWAWYERLPATAHARAQERLILVQQVEAMEGAGAGRAQAVVEVAALAGIGARTLWSWLRLVEAVRRDDRLPALAPRHRAGPRGADPLECSPEFWDVLRSDYLRLEQPSFSSSYRRAARIAAAKGWQALPERTMRRRLASEVSRTTQVLARRGVEALRAMRPPQTRDKSTLHAMECVNADYHRWDVFVRMGDEVVRPQMVAFQDIHSGRIIAWRMARTPNSTDTGLALGEMVERWGIPLHVVLDNGREFAAKWITGGTPTRYRFKVREDDVPGLLTSLGVEVHWATPYSGQSKPIERAFRDLCDAVAKDPRFAGAWTGNRPDAKPENYASRAVPLADFLRVVAEGIEEHNARVGRRSDVARGRSFNAVFDASYEQAPIRRATAEQRRLWLMGAEGLRGDTRSGLLRLEGNEYWSDWCRHEIAGRRVVARFDPADLWAGLHVYALSGEYLGLAECKAKAGFLDVGEAREHADVGEAREHARALRVWRASERRALEAARQLSARQVGALLDEVAPEPAEPVEARVVRPVFGAPSKPVAKINMPSEPATQGHDDAHAKLTAEFEAAREARSARETAETDHDRFRRALDLEARQARGEALTAEQRRWLAIYEATPECRGLRRLFDVYGEGMFG